MAATEAVHASNLEKEIGFSAISERNSNNNSVDRNALQLKTNEDHDVLQNRHALSLQAETEFNKHQKLLLRNIKSPTIQKVEEFLNGYEITDIVISDLTSDVMVSLKNGDLADMVLNTLNQTMFEEQDVSVAKCLTNKLVCVAHLPLDYSEDDFRQLVCKYGSFERCFLMRSDSSGESKGYGFVEFSDDNNKSTNICDDLDWTEMKDHRLNVDFVEDHFQVYKKLHSRCLLIDNLPKDFTDVSKLREIFSSIISPVYCQILMQETESLGYGIIEFREPKDAEEMWRTFQKHKINDTEISLSFCIPGRHAVSIYNRIMWKINDKLNSIDKNSLLPDPVFVSPLVTNAPLVKSLKVQYPQLNDNFTKVLQHLHQSYMKQVMSRNCKPGLLGPAPSLPMSPIMNPNMQLGLFIMLAVQTISQSKKQCSGHLCAEMNLLSGVASSTDIPSKLQNAVKPSLLGDPITAKAGIILQCLSNQLMPQPLLPSSTPKPLMTIGQPELKFPATMDQLLQNVRNININLLMNLGQALIAMQNSLSVSLKENQKQGPSQGSGPHSLLGAPPPSLMGPMMGRDPGLISPNSLGGGQKSGLLGHAPKFGEKSLSDSAPKSLMDSVPKSLMDSAPKSLMDSAPKSLMDSAPKGLLGTKPKSLLDMDFGNMGYGKSGGTFQVPFRNGPVGNLMNQRGGSKSSFANNLQFSGQKNPDFNFTAMYNKPNQNMNQPGGGKKASLLGAPPRKQSYQDDVWLASPPFQQYDRNDWENSSQTGGNENYSGGGSGSWDYNDSGYGGDSSGYDSYGNNGAYVGQYQESSAPASTESLDPQAKLAQEAREYAKYTEQYYNQMYSGYDQNYNYATTDYSNSYNNQQMQQQTQATTDNSYNQDYGNTMNTGNTAAVSSSSNTSKVKNYSSKHPSFGQIYDTSGVFRNPNNSNPGYDTSYGNYNADNSQYNNYSFSQSLQANAKNAQDSLLGPPPQMTGDSTAYSPPAKTSVLNTPIGQKRSFSHLLPPPEPSPEGDYVIGQHSQGIGGHYATSYVKRQKLDEKFSNESYS